MKFTLNETRHKLLGIKLLFDSENWVDLMNKIKASSKKKKETIPLPLKSSFASIQCRGRWSHKASGINVNDTIEI